MGFLRLVSVGWFLVSGLMVSWAGPDLDLFVSRELVSSTSSVYADLVKGLNSLNQSLGTTLIDKDKVLERSRQAFESEGGFYYDRFVDSLRFQVQVAMPPVLRMRVAGKFAVEQVEKNFQASGFVKNGAVYSRGPIFLRVAESEIRASGDVEGLDAGLIAAPPFPADSLFGLRIGENLILMLSQKNPEIAEVLESVEITWGKTSAQLKIGMKNPAAAAMAGGVLAGVLHGVQATPIPDSVAGFRQLSDLHTYAQAPLVKNYLQEVVRQSTVVTEGQVVRLNMAAIGEPGFFFLSMIPALLSYGVDDSKSPSVVMTILNMLNSEHSEEEYDEGEMIDDPTCQAQLVQAAQALDFYNMDYNSNRRWEDVREVLFEEGYLSEDMDCEGIPLWKSPRFVTGPDNQLMLKDPAQ